MRASRMLFCSIVAVTIAVSPVRAGQVRITVAPGGSFVFEPSTANLNEGDQVVWVWGASFHSATNGPPCTVPASPLFNSGVLNFGAQFSWKSTTTGNVPYFCTIHCLSSGMTANLNITATGTAVSSFRITEVRHSSFADSNFVEIANLGAASGDLGLYRLSVQAGAAVDIPLTDVTVPVGGHVVLHLGKSGTNTATNIFFASASLPATGSASLYVPNSVNTALTDANMMVDFVEWGAGGQANEATAVTAGFWTAGQFAPAVAEGHSLEFCGTSTDRGASFWREIRVPNPGGDDHCATPVEVSTWGSLKAGYPH